MKLTRALAAALLLGPLAARAANLEQRTFWRFDWRETTRLANTPICDVFQGGRRVSDARYRKYQQLEQDILLARDAINRRDGSASRFLEVVRPGDFGRPCS